MAQVAYNPIALEFKEVGSQSILRSFLGSKQPTIWALESLAKSPQDLPQMARVAHAAGFRSNSGNGIIAGLKRAFLLLLFFSPAREKKSKGCSYQILLTSYSFNAFNSCRPFFLIKKDQKIKASTKTNVKV